MGRVGAFFFVGNHMITNDVNTELGNKYGEYINYSSHWDLWRAFILEYPEYKCLDYDYFPRGRVIYSTRNKKYILYMDTKLNKAKYINQIKNHYGLKEGNYRQEFDEHYQSLQPVEYIDEDEIAEDVFFSQPLEKYIERETY